VSITVQTSPRELDEFEQLAAGDHASFLINLVVAGAAALSLVTIVAGVSL